MGAEVGRGICLDRISDLDQLRVALRSERACVGADAWLLSWATEHSAVDGQPDHHDLLDEAAGQGPMLLWAFDEDTAFANATALALGRVVGLVRLDDNSIVVCDEDDQPTGELKEMAAVQLVLRHAPGASASARLQWYTDTITEQNAHGIT